jgi:murein DD-endopeptidase MepM/ murein hydrolase activator NlpD
MIRPDLGKFPLTQRFDDECCRRTYQQTFGMNGHNGLDLGTPMRTPIYASHSGNIYSGWDEGGYGIFIFITGGGWESVVGHLDSLVRGGGYVNEGELIAYSGNTGFSLGPHCHFGVRPLPYNRTNGFFGYVDPLPLLAKPVDRPTPQEVISHFRTFVGKDPNQKEIDDCVARGWGYLNGILLQYCHDRWQEEKRRKFDSYSSKELLEAAIKKL